MRPSDASKTAPAVHEEFAEDVRRTLSSNPRRISTRFLYDPLGSALFKAICHLPWYRIARTERRLLDLHGGEILTRHGHLSTLLELGPGTGEKLLTLLANGRTPANGHLPERVYLIDVSREALNAAVRALSVYPQMSVWAHQASYEAGLAEVMEKRKDKGRTLVLFLGSNIGNFDPPGAEKLLGRIRAALSSGDGMLLGADLVKPARDLLLAYDDPLGVTAAFNRNLLVRMNRELGADFDPEGFAHRAVWNREMSRMEMHLVSTRRQAVQVPASRLSLTFEDGETIWTESSYKYRPGEINALLDRAGFQGVEQWTEDQFALTLAEAR
jgi:dimethylhistidine N-methyltransferase